MEREIQQNLPHNRVSLVARKYIKKKKCSFCCENMFVTEYSTYITGQIIFKILL